MTIVSTRDLTSIAVALSNPDARELSSAWRQSAACRQEDPELFFPVGPGGAATATEIQQAKAVCARCPVRRQCLAFALSTGQSYGIWGGYDENERRPLHRQWREARLTADEDRPASAGSF